MSPVHSHSLPPPLGEDWGGGKRPSHRQQTNRRRAPIPTFPQRGKEQTP